MRKKSGTADPPGKGLDTICVGVVSQTTTAQSPRLLDTSGLDLLSLPLERSPRGWREVARKRI
jgi:hypothetical protein